MSNHPEPRPVSTRVAAGEQPAELVRLAVRLALGAAEVVRAGGRSRAEVDVKSTVTDLVTATDRDTERWLVETIVRERPGDALLGEEGGARAGTSRVRWVVDPIDGTVNYVLGLPQYAVSVAAEVDGIVTAGAVCSVATGELFWAGRRGGAWYRPGRAGRAAGDDPLDLSAGEVRLAGPRSVPLDRSVVGTGFGYDPAMRARQAAVVAALLPRVADIRRLGAASLDLCAVAAGRLDGYFEAGLSPWDYAAGLLIATEAGCRSGGAGTRRPDEKLVVVAGPELFGPLADLLAELGAGGVTSST